MSLQKSYLMLRDLKLMVSWVPTHFEAAIAKARWAPPCCWKMASWKWRSRKRSVTPSSKSEWWLANLKSSVGPTWLGTVETLATGKTMDWHISTRTPTSGIRRFMMVQEKQYNKWIGRTSTFGHGPHAGTSSVWGARWQAEGTQGCERSNGADWLRCANGEGCWGRGKGAKKGASDGSQMAGKSWRADIFSLPSVLLQHPRLWECIYSKCHSPAVHSFPPGC